MVSVGGVLILIKILGFVRQMVVATVFGATADTDLVTLSQSFVGNAQYVLTQALLTAMVPIYVRLREEKPSSAGSFATDVLKSGTLISGAIALVLFICSPLLARLLAPTYTPVMTARLSAYLRTFSWTLIPLVWMAAFHGALNANKRFIPGQLERLYQSIIIMAMAIFFSARLGVNALVVGFCLYILVSTVITGVQARRYFLPSGTNPLRSPAYPFSADHDRSAANWIRRHLREPNRRQDPDLRTGERCGHSSGVRQYPHRPYQHPDRVLVHSALLPYGGSYRSGKNGGRSASDTAVGAYSDTNTATGDNHYCVSGGGYNLLALWTGSVWRGGDPNVGSSPVWLRLCIYPDGLEGDLRPGTIWIPELPAANPQQYRRDSCKHCAEYSALPPIRRTRSYPCQQCCYSGDGSAQHGYSPAMYAGAFYDSTISDTTIFMCRRGDICIPLH